MAIKFVILYFVVNCFTALISSSRCSRHSPGTIKHMPPLTHHTNRATAPHAAKRHHSEDVHGAAAPWIDAPLPLPHGEEQLRVAKTWWFSESLWHHSGKKPS